MTLGLVVDERGELGREIVGHKPGVQIVRKLLLAQPAEGKLVPLAMGQHLLPARLESRVADFDLRRTERSEKQQPLRGSPLAKVPE
jgi:hypothetical protein